MKDNREVAEGAGLSVEGWVRGVIILVQETRFRLEDENGKGYLFTLGRESGVSLDELLRLSRQRIPVAVEYRGAPDLGATATTVRAASAGGVGQGV